MRLLPFSFATLWALTVGAEDLKFAPQGQVYAKTEHTEVTFECEGEPPFREIECRFSQVSLWTREGAGKPAPASPAAQPTAKQRKEWRELCANLEATLTKQAHELADQPKGRLLAHEIRAAEMRSACRCGTDWYCVRRGVEALDERAQKACRIRGFSFGPIRFERVAERRWLAKQQSSICSVVTVIVLEHEKDNQFLWTMTQTRSGVVDASDPVWCTPLDTNKPMIYSWRYRSEFILPCSLFSYDP